MKGENKLKNTKHLLLLMLPVFPHGCNSQNTTKQETAIENEYSRLDLKESL
jgi:hypothetical protein